MQLYRSAAARILLEKLCAGLQLQLLLIAGGNDDEVIQLNRAALSSVQCVKDLVIVRGANHLFEERGALDQVSNLAWIGSSGI